MANWAFDPSIYKSQLLSDFLENGWTKKSRNLLCFIFISGIYGSINYNYGSKNIFLTKTELKVQVERNGSFTI